MSRRLSGLMAKRRGDQFESILETHCRIKGLNLLKILMGCVQVKKRGKYVLEKRTNPFDFIVTKDGEGSIFFDAKTRQGDSITYSDFWSSKSTKHQVLTLASLANFGERAGFMVWFRASDRICFIPATKIATMKARTSFGPDDGLPLGTFDNFEIERLWNDFE